MDPIEQLRQSFLIEAEELVLAAEQSLSQLDNDEGAADLIATAFRAIHSIKGGAGAFGFQSLVGLAHALEAALDRVRTQKKISIDHEPVALFIRAVDAIGDRLSSLKEGVEPRNVEALIAELDGYVKGTSPSGVGKTPVLMPTPTQVQPIQEEAATGLIVRLSPSADLFRRVVEPRHLFQRLEEIGSVKARTIYDSLPHLDALNPSECYLKFECHVDSAISIESLRDMCAQTFDESEISIVIGADAAKEQLAEEMHANETVSAPIDNRSKPGREANASGTLGLPPGRAATTTIRVDLERIDKLMNLVGEIVITQSILTDRINKLSTIESLKLSEGVEALSRQMRELQDNVMAVRAQPVKAVFQRIPRMVRELSEALRKEVRVEVAGENTEIDKTIIEELTDPLIHMIRNAMDHGIESSDERLVAGKRPFGTIRISAEQKNGRIFINIEDDGRGLDRERLLKKAIEHEIVSHNEVLQPSEIDNLIFHPGLSTADKVTDVSGRGVGMDVVRRNVEALGGRIFVESRPGKGSSFCLALPLTLAVLEGMVVRVGSQRIVIPITAIVETCRSRDHLCQTMPSGARVMRFRGQLAPLWELGAILGIADAEEEKIVVVVENESGKILCLGVDEIVGQQQVVVKSLEANYKRVAGAASATILGDGLVALILDVNLMPAPAHGAGYITDIKEVA